jgi:hypothetical protein
VAIMVAHGYAIVTLRDSVREGSLAGTSDLSGLILISPHDEVGFCGVGPGCFFEQGRRRLAQSGPAIS